MAGIRLSQRAGWSAGQPISDLMSRALANPDLISLAAGFVDQQSLPAEATHVALQAIWSDPQSSRAALQYGTTPGYPPLREVILQDLFRADGLTTTPSGVTTNRVVVTAGSNQLLHLVGESLLDPGDIVLCAAPTYLVYLGTLANLGARAVGVATDHVGMVPEALDDQMRYLQRRGELPRVKAIYLVTYYDNPRGITLSLERRQRIVDLAKRWSRHGPVYVIADSAYRQLRYRGDDVPSLLGCDPTGESVVLTGTFSKCYSPGIRVGWGILPPQLVEPVCNQKGNIDFGSPNFNQHLMAKILELGLLEQHLQRLRQCYQRKLDAMLSAAEQCLGRFPEVRWQRPEGGLYVWVELPKSVDTCPDGQLFCQAIEQGVLYVPGQFCYPTDGQPVARNHMRLSFGVQPVRRIEQGMAALSRAIEQVLQ